MPKRAQLTKRPVGAPTTFKPEYIKQAEILARNGATQADLAECFGVSTFTIRAWLVKYPDFAQAVHNGNDVFNPRVERALAERAMGFYADKYIWRATSDEERERGLPEYVIVPTERVYYPPDVTAAIYWTKNRMPEKWRDVHNHTVTGTLKSSDDFLAEIRKDILLLQQDGYLKTIDLQALPAPKEEE